MGDAGEGLIDAESRIQERMEELARARAEKREHVATDQQSLQGVASLKLARVDLERQRAATTHEGRRAVIDQALGEIDRRIAALGGGGAGH